MEKEIDLRVYVRILLKYWILIAGIILFVFGVRTLPGAEAGVLGEWDCPACDQYGGVSFSNDLQGGIIVFFSDMIISLRLTDKP